MYILFKCTQDIYQDRPYARSSLNKFTKMKIIPSMLFNHNEMKLELKTKYNTSITEEITREIGKYLEVNRNENTTYQSLWNATKAVPREKFIALNGRYL